MQWSYTKTNFPSNLKYDGKIVHENRPQNLCVSWGNWVEIYMRYMFWERLNFQSLCYCFVRGIHNPWLEATHQWLMDAPHKGPVMWKKFPHHDVIMQFLEITTALYWAIKMALLPNQLVIYIFMCSQLRARTVTLLNRLLVKQMLNTL